MKKINLAIIGITGLVGNSFYKYLLELKEYIDELYLFASKSNINNKYLFNDKYIMVDDLKNIDYSILDVCVFLATDEVSKREIPIALKHKVFCIDNSSIFRLSENSDLIVPEINIDLIKKEKKNRIISNPNCCVIPIALILNALMPYKIKRVVATTMQSVSGSGKNGLIELKNHLTNNKIDLYPYNLYDTIIPYIGDILENGNCKEEEKIIYELKKIFKNFKVKVAVTTTRVPITYGHAISLAIEFKKNISVNTVKSLLAKNHISVVDIPTTVDIFHKKNVYAGRIRKDLSTKHGILIYLTSNNITRGASYNAYLILENYLEKNIKK